MIQVEVMQTFLWGIRYKDERNFIWINVNHLSKIEDVSNTIGICRITFYHGETMIVAEDKDFLSNRINNL